MEDEIIKLLKDCRYPIEHIHNGDHDESKLLKRIDDKILELGEDTHKRKLLVDYEKHEHGSFFSIRASSINKRINEFLKDE